MSLYPLFLKLAGRRVLVVGGGPVAAAKLDGLLAAGAAVDAVAPGFVPGFDRPGVTLHRRPFAPSDVDGAWFVLAAAPPPVNREVHRAAEERRVWVNSVDEPATASAYTGGVFRRPGLTAAISTEGEAPALAGLLREALEALLPEDYDDWVAEARRLREEWKARGEPVPRRRGLLLDRLNALHGRTP